MLRDPSQEQVTLRTCVAWQAGYRGDRERGNASMGEREKKKGGKGEKSTWEREGSQGRTGPDCSPPVPPPCGLQGGSCSLSEFPSGTDLRAPGSKLKYELQEGRMGGGETERKTEAPKNERQTGI